MKKQHSKPEGKLGLPRILSDWASKYHDQCLTNFNNVGIPSGRAEYWRFVPPKLWDNISTVDTKISELSSDQVINYDSRPDFYVDFIDGVVDQTSLKNLSENLIGSEISGFESVVMDNDHWAKDYIGKAEINARKPYERPFALLNGSEVSQGLFLYCKKSPGQPVHIFYSGEGNSSASIRHLIKIAKGAELHIIEHFSGRVKYNIVLEGFLEDESILHHNRLINGSLQNPIVTHLFIECMSSSVVKTVGINLSSTAVRNETFLNLNGSGCFVTVAGLGIGSSKNSICDNTVFILHRGHDSKSRQIIKNVLSKGSKGVFQGKIFVESEAQKTDGYQMSNGLLLDEESDFLVKPELEIYADDVICSHGSISGSIDKEHLFYLRSRGIAENIAQKILIEAYLEEVITEIEDLQFSHLVRDEIQKVLN